MYVWDVGIKRYFYGTTNGGTTYYENTMGGKSYCSKISWVSDRDYDAICAGGIVNDYPWYDGSCPKGWGRSRWRYRNDSYSAQYGQGYIKNGGDPIYSTVTKYRDTVYNYTAGRIAKA